ncbi:MAG: type II secretion system F family protein [Candidatus Magasanikbacteria bacterium]
MKPDKVIKNKITPPKKKSGALSFTFGFAEESVYFVENLSMLLASGMDIIEALTAIKAEVKSTKLINIIDELVENINSGFSLWQALEKTKLLPPHIISLIKIGEDSGRLHESLAVVVIQQSKSRSFKSKIRAAMMYPVFVMGVAMTVGIGIAWFILPKLSTVFSQLNLKLPLVTRLLMSFGGFLSRYGSVVVPSFIVGVIIFFYFLFFYQKTKFIGQAILFSIPGIKNLIREVELARFGYIMGTLLEAGLPVTEALNSLKESGTLRAYGKIYVQLKEGVEEGKSFEECFRANKHIRKLIPTTIQSLIAVGERSGRLGKIFLNISENYESKTELTTKNLSVILEPLLLVIVWLGVVAVAMAVILPIYSLVGGLNQKPQDNNTSNSVQISPPKPNLFIASSTAFTTSTISSTSTLSNTSTTTILFVTTTPVVQNTSTVIIIGTQGTVVSTSTPNIPTTGFLEVSQNKVGFLNIRTAPSSKSELVRKASIGEKFEYISIQDGWYQIVLSPDQYGWVSAQYIQTASSTF